MTTVFMTLSVDVNSHIHSNMHLFNRKFGISLSIGGSQVILRLVRSLSETPDLHVCLFFLSDLHVFSLVKGDVF